MSTIKEVADLARVSVGTVSHVITGSVQVSEPLRQKVLAAIQQLDYHPNHVARSLKTSRTRTLGIIVPDLTISFFPQVIRGAESAAREGGYSLMTVNSGDDPERQQELLSLLRSQRVEGILLIAAAGAVPSAQVARVIEAGIPIVCVDRVPDRINVDSVSVDDVAAARLGAEHLIARGYRRIAMVTGPISLKNERQRILGYRQALEKNLIPVDKRWIWHGNLRTSDVASLCRTKLGQAARPDALYCTNGPTAMGALLALRACGLQTPRDLGFITFDELASADVFRPAVTTIVQPAFRIGFEAAGILLRRIAGECGSATIAVRLPASLEIRESTSLLRESQDLGSYRLESAG